MPVFKETADNVLIQNGAEGHMMIEGQTKLYKEREALKLNLSRGRVVRFRDTTNVFMVTTVNTNCRLTL